MNLNRTFLHHFNDISESISKIKGFIQDLTYEQFCEDEKTQYAVIRALEIIGEAAKQIPDEIKDQFSNLPWQEIIRMRDKLIHHYYGIDVEVLWNTVNEDLDQLQDIVQALISKFSK
jgi:uncharacterized protein with HEPN domain